MFRNDLLQSKRVLITGGGTGLGRGMAERFLELGATVYICGRRQEVLTATAAELQPKRPIHALACDVRKLDAVERMMETIWSAGALDILVNNAAGNFIARTEDLSPRAFESVINIVLMGTLHCTMACGRRWRGLRGLGRLRARQAAEERCSDDSDHDRGPSTGSLHTTLHAADAGTSRSSIIREARRQGA